MANTSITEGMFRAGKWTAPENRPAFDGLRKRYNEGWKEEEERDGEVFSKT